MSRRYDTRTTTFSPEGRLYQVEYAMEAISNAGAALGVLAKDGVVLAAEKRITSKVSITDGCLPRCSLTLISASRTSLLRHLNHSSVSCAQLLDTNAVGVRREKMYKLDDHVACSVAGITGEGMPCRCACVKSAETGASAPAVVVCSSLGLPSHLLQVSASLQRLEDSVLSCSPCVQLTPTS